MANNIPLPPPGSAIRGLAHGHNSAFSRGIVTPFEMGHSAGLSKYVHASDPVTTLETTDTVLQTRNALFFNMAVSMPDVGERKFDLSPWGQSHREHDLYSVHQYGILCELPQHQVTKKASKLCQPRVTATLNGIYPDTAVAPIRTVGEAYVRLCYVDTEHVRFAGIARDHRRHERLMKVTLGELPSDEQPLAANSERVVAGGTMGSFTVTVLHNDGSQKRPIATANSNMVACVPRPRFAPESDRNQAWDSSKFVSQFRLPDAKSGLKGGMVPVSMKTVEEAIRDDVRNMFICASIIQEDMASKVLAHDANREYQCMAERGTCFPPSYRHLVMACGDLRMLVDIQNIEDYLMGNANAPAGLGANGNALRGVFEELTGQRNSKQVDRSIQGAAFAVALHLYKETHPNMTEADMIEKVFQRIYVCSGLVRRYLGNFKCMSYTTKKRECSGYVIRT